MIPVLACYRYTLNQAGTGFYVEPNAGYCFGSSTVQDYNEINGISDGTEKVKGPIAE